MALQQSQAAEDGKESQRTLLPVIGPEFCTHSGMELILSKVEAWSWGNYNVTDAQGKFLFKVEGKLSLRWTRTIHDPAGRRLLRIHKKWMTPEVMDAFIDTDDGNKRVFIVKSSLTSPPHFSLDVFLPCNTSAQPDFKLEGKYFQSDYAVYSGERFVAQAKRKPDAPSYVLGCGAYTIKILPGVDQVFVVALILIMDEIHLEASVCHDTP